MGNTFGKFIKEKRLGKGLGLRELAEILKVSPAYVSDVENGRRNPFKYLVLRKLISILNLSDEESQEMYNCVGVDTDSIPPDIEAFIATNRSCIKSLREWLLKENKKE